jgi:uncharacterized protein (DUF302 family)
VCFPVSFPFLGASAHLESGFTPRAQYDAMTVDAQKRNVALLCMAIALCIRLGGAVPARAQAVVAETGPVAEVTARGSFDDVRQQLLLAIENRGLIVSHESKVGEMLERTGKDLGASNRIYEQAEVFEFCSATLSRQVMEADARLLALCPFGIGIYTLPGEGDRVHLVYRRSRSDGNGPAAEALKRVDRLLREIVQEAGQ